MSQKDDNNRKDEKSLKLYIVRHGETEWNLIKKISRPVGFSIDRKWDKDNERYGKQA